MRTKCYISGFEQTGPLKPFLKTFYFRKLEFKVWKQNVASISKNTEDGFKEYMLPRIPNKDDSINIKNK